MKIAANSVLVMQGDSITDAGRSFSVEEKQGLGDGYAKTTAAVLDLDALGFDWNHTI